MGRELITLIGHKLPDYRTFNYARLGAFSLSTNSIRYLAQEDTIIYENKQDTPSSHYRKYIEDNKITFPSKKFNYDGLSYPYFAQSARVPMALYIDMRSAYKQITSAYGFEVFYEQGKLLALGTTTPDNELFTMSKICRGLLVTAHNRQASFTEWKNSRLAMVKFNNKNYAPYLQYAIWRTLHAVMSKLRPFIYYCHTDGVIANHRMLPRIDKILSRYHIQYVIKEQGSAVIKTTGCYRIGEHQTANFNMFHHQSTDYIISDEYDDWWLTKFTKAVEYRNAR